MIKSVCRRPLAGLRRAADDSRRRFSTCDGLRAICDGLWTTCDALRTGCDGSRTTCDGELPPATACGRLATAIFRVATQKTRISWHSSQFALGKKRQLARIGRLKFHKKPLASALYRHKIASLLPVVFGEGNKLELN
jgi:hypothetical protein